MGSSLSDKSFPKRAYTVLAQVSLSYSVENGRFPCITHPSATASEETVRLACVKPAASVRSEPGSNSQVENLIYGYYQSHHCVKHRTQTSGHAQIDENIFTHQTIIADHPGNIVLIKKRVRQSSLRQSDLSNHPQTMPPTFLFLLYKIVKEQTASKPSKISPARQTRDHHSTRRSNPHQRLVCGAGLLDQSNQPVNHFF